MKGSSSIKSFADLVYLRIGAPYNQGTFDTEVLRRLSFGQYREKKSYSESPTTRPIARKEEKIGK